MRKIENQSTDLLHERKLKGFESFNTSLYLQFLLQLTT